MANQYNYSIVVDARLSKGASAKLQTDLNKMKLNPNVNKGMKDLNKQTTFFSQNLGDVSKKILEWTALTTVIFGTLRAIKDGVIAVKELDTALVELKKVTNLNTQELAQFTMQAMEAGEAVARTTSEIVQGASDFARAGYDAQQALDLSEQAAMLVNVGDGIDNVTEATSSMIAVMKGFNIDASNMMHILDSINEVSNNYAVDSGQLNDGIKRVSATMSSANNSFEETIGLITGVTEVIRDASRASTGLRTIALRLRGMGTDGEDLASNTAKLEDEFNQIGLTLFELDGSFKSTYDILEGLSGKWDGLSDTVQASLTYLISGIRRSDILSAALTNMGSITGATTTALNSFGSATKENAIYMESIEAKTRLFNKAVQDLWIHAINSESIKKLVDLGTTMVKIADAIGLTNIAVTILAGVLIKKAIPIFGALIESQITLALVTKGTTAALEAQAAVAAAYSTLLTGVVAVGLVGLIALAYEFTTSLEEQEATLIDIQAQLSTLAGEYDNLATKMIREGLTDAEQERLIILEQELALQKAIADVEAKRLAQRRMGGADPTEQGTVVELGVNILALEQGRLEATPETLLEIDTLIQQITEDAVTLGTEISPATQGLIDRFNALKEATTGVSTEVSNLAKWTKEARAILTDPADQMQIEIIKDRAVQYGYTAEQAEEYANALATVVNEEFRVQAEQQSGSRTLEQIQKQYSLATEKLEKLTEAQSKLSSEGANFVDILSKLKSEFPDLLDNVSNVADAQQAVADAIYNTGIESAVAYTEMNKNSADFWKNALEDSSITTDALINLAHLSAADFAGMEQAKAQAAIANAAVAAKAWSNYFGMSLTQLRSQKRTLSKEMRVAETLGVDVSGGATSISEIDSLIGLYTNLADVGAGAIAASTGGGGGGGSRNANQQTYIDLLEEELKIKKDLIDDDKELWELQLDLLNKQYEQEDALLELEERRLAVAKAEAALANTLAEESAKILTDEGWQWIADPRAVREAEEALADARTDLEDTERDQLRAQQKQLIEDQIEIFDMQSSTISEFISDMKLLNDSVADNVTSWQGLLSALDRAGISYPTLSNPRTSASLFPSTEGGSLPNLTDIPNGIGDLSGGTFNPSLTAPLGGSTIDSRTIFQIEHLTIVANDLDEFEQSIRNLLPTT